MSNTQNWKDIKEQHLSREVDNYSGFKEGDYEPSLGKYIKLLIIKDVSYIVYVDTEYMVEWSTNKYFVWDEAVKNREFQDGFGLIVNRIGYLEEVSKDILPVPESTDNGPIVSKNVDTDYHRPRYLRIVGFFSGNVQKSHKINNDLVAFKRLLGESMGRLLDEKDTKNALIILDQAEEFINQRRRINVLRFAFITSIVVGLCALFIFLIHSCQTNYPCWFTNKVYQYSLCVAFGALGALLSLLQRGKQLNVEPSLSTGQYSFEGFVRILYGMIAALIFLLGYNGGLFLNVIKDHKHELELLLLFSIVVGYSERFVPTFIAQIEDGLLKKKSVRKSKTV